jgi:hypothetical protein
MSLEAAASTQSDFLIPGLSYTLGQTAWYINARHFSSTMALGSNIYSWQTGQKVIRFLLTEPSGALVDLSTVRLAFDLKNNDGSNPLTLTGNIAHVSFQPPQDQNRWPAGRGLIWHNRLVAMLMKLLPPRATGAPPWRASGARRARIPSPARRRLRAIAANGWRHCIAPIHGIWAAWPVIICSRAQIFHWSLSWRLCDPVQVAVYGNGSNASQTVPADAVPAACMTRCTLIQAIQNQLAQALLEGKPLPMPIQKLVELVLLQHRELRRLLVDQLPARLQPARKRVRHLQLSGAELLRTLQATMCNSFQSWHGSVGVLASGGHLPRAAANRKLALARPPSGVTRRVLLPALENFSNAFEPGRREHQPSNLQDGQLHQSVSTSEQMCSQSPGSGMAAFQDSNTRTGNDQIRMTWDSVTQTSGWEVDRQFLHLQFDSMVELHNSGVSFALTDGCISKPPLEQPRSSAPANEYLHESCLFQLTLAELSTMQLRPAPWRPPLRALGACCPGPWPRAGGVALSQGRPRRGRSPFFRAAAAGPPDQWLQRGREPCARGTQGGGHAEEQGAR